MPARITVVGSINIDLVLKVSHLPAPGETLSSDDFQLIPGGKGANQAVGAARLGAKVAMLGSVGDDPFGPRLKDGLTKEGISTEHVCTIPGTTSGMALITVAENGQNTIVLSPGANGLVSQDMVQAAEKLVENCDLLLLQLEIPLETVEFAVRLAKSHDRRVILNPAPAKNMKAELLQSVDYLVPNEVEAADLTGQEVADLASAERAAVTLQEMCGGAVIVITLGSQGALLLQKGEKPLAVPTLMVPAVDTTAAGDAFVAGMAVALAKGKPAVEAVRWGCAAGSLTVTKLGAQTSIPTEAEVKQLLKTGHTKTE
jgi:ribokinase